MTTFPSIEVTNRHQGIEGPPPLSASCLGHPPTLWFPEKGKGKGDGGGGTAHPAVAICQGCELRVSCLDGAVRRNETFGIWGGAGEARRRVLRRALRAGPVSYDRAIRSHFRVIDGLEDPVDRVVLQAFAAGATHGRRVTYARGCRCEPCTLAAACNTARGTKPTTTTAAPAAA